MITPSFALTATERVLPSMALDFTTATLDSRVTFTRSGGTATVINSNGYIAVVGVDVPRFDYDPVTLACKGLLIEESRTNLLTNSNATASATRATATAGAGIGPDNTSSAISIIEDGTAASTHYALTDLVSIPSGSVYTLSVYAKNNGRNLRLWTSSSTPWGGTAQIGEFNLTDGTVISESGGASASIKNAGNGWYRCIVTTISTTATANARLQFSLYNSGISYDGNGSSGIYVYGAQLEQATFPTSYIPTTTAQVTRTADVATMTGTNFSDWYNTSEGTFLTTCSTMSVGASKYAFALTENSGTDNQQILLANYTNTGRCRYLGYETTTNTISVYPSLVHAANESLTLCVAMKTNSTSMAVNGNTANTDLSGAIPTSLTTLRIGHNSSAALFLDGHMASLYYYPQRLITAEVQAFSKG